MGEKKATKPTQKPRMRKSWNTLCLHIWHGVQPCPLKMQSVSTFLGLIWFIEDFKEQTHWERPWYWETLKTGGEELQKNVYCFTDYAKAVDCVDHSKLWTILKEMGMPDHLTCLLRNLYAGQEATVRTGHGTTDWFQIGAGVCQGSILSPCLCRVHHEKRWAGWSINWNQDCREKYQ